MPMTRSFVLPLALGALLAGPAVRFARGADAPAPTPASPADAPAAPGDAPAAPAAAPAKARKPLDPKDRAKLVELFRQYLDKSSAQAFEARIGILEEVKRQRAAGVEVLADPDALRGIVYAARPYEPFFEKKMLPREARDAEISLDSATGILNVAWDALRLSVSLPAAYPDLLKGKKLASTPPYPAIVTLHELEDFQDAKGTRKFPGMEVIKRRWNRNDKVQRQLLDNWFVFAPVATRARFVEDGRLKPDRVPLEVLWRRYHVDYDRIFLEGGSDALTFAAAQPNYLAGVIVRGATADMDKELVRNLGQLPVYVVGDSPALKTLAAGGHPANLVTMGTLDGLPTWLSNVPRRTIPRDFFWTVKDPDVHSFAHWINVDALEPSAEKRDLRVSCLDTKEDPNTVRIEARGIRTISIFLSDRQVDLDRDVRLVVNGTVIKEARVPSNKPGGRSIALPAKLERQLDTIFDHETVDVRGSLYFGWYFPVSLQAVIVPGDAKPEQFEPAAGPSCPTTNGNGNGDGGGASGTEGNSTAERVASTYFGKAEENEKAGNVAKALDLYRKAAAAGESTFKARAEAKVKELEAPK
jgi:hypothetical protein